MTIEVAMPQLGESIAEGTLVKWYKKVGEKVQRDEVLFEISTDKVDTEVHAPEEGYLERILVAEGETVPVHTPVCTISESPPVAVSEETSGTSSESATPQAAPARSAPSREDPAKEIPKDAPVARPAPEPAKAAAAAAPAAARSPALRAAVSAGAERTSPLVRRIAAEHGVDLAAVPGTGIGGRVTKDDILRHVDGGGASGNSRHAAADRVAEARMPAETEKPAGPAGQAGPRELDPESGDRIEPMSTMRQRISDHMLLSRRTSAHVTTIFEVDMTAVRELKSLMARQFDERYGVRLTYTPFIVLAVCRGLRKFPILNASLEGKNVHFHGSINVGIAVALENGLIVPVVRRADKMGLRELAHAINDLARRARAKELNPEEVQDGTFTITNPGIFGGLVGTPIIHQPQVAILYVGAVQKRPVVLPDTDAIAVRSMAYFSLTFDHRLIDGAVADRFLSTVKSEIEGVSFDSLGVMK